MSTFCRECGATIEEAEPGAESGPLCPECDTNWVHCDSCGQLVAEDETKTTRDGETVCANCADTAYLVCGECGELVPADDIATQYLDKPLCDKCYDAEFFTCAECGGVFRDSDGRDLNGDQVCDNCYDENTVCCNDCGDVIEDPEDRRTINGETVCTECADEYYDCAGCGRTFHYDNLDLDDNGEYYCDACAGTCGVIRPYSYKPAWNFHKLPAETAVGALYLGTELEVDNTERKVDNQEAAEAMLDALPAICKADSSIDNGFEIVTQPLTYDYARSIEGSFDKALGYLRQNGFSGHNHGGMHVHMTRSVFSLLHTIKFCRLFSNNPNFWFRVSQRKQENLDRWAGFGDIPRLDRMPKDCRRYCNNHRYTALNFTSETVEVRVFNSSIRTDRFFKNLEACQAAFDFSRTYGMADMLADRFIDYIVDRRMRYPRLSAFLAETGLYRTLSVGSAQVVLRQLRRRAERLRTAATA